MSPALDTKPRSLAEYRDEILAATDAALRRIGIAALNCDAPALDAAWNDLMHLRGRLACLDDILLAG